MDNTEEKVFILYCQTLNKDGVHRHREIMSGCVAVTAEEAVKKLELIFCGGLGHSGATVSLPEKVPVWYCAGIHNEPMRTKTWEYRRKKKADWFVEEIPFKMTFEQSLDEMNHGFQEKH